jgi:hypothetical protein
MALENLKKHVGILGNTGVRVAVVFRKLPTDETHCLIVETERLPDSYHDAILQCTNSREASETNDLFEVLNRRTFSDGTNCLTSLHQRGYLRKEPITNVTMLPLPGQAVPLALINATIDNKVAEYKTSQAKKLSPAVTEVMQDPVVVAKGLILQAELLEKDALMKREEAYALAPELKPGRGRPSTPEELKDEIAKDRKQKRKERDQRNNEIAKAEKKESALESRVLAKLERDSERLGSTKTE